VDSDLIIRPPVQRGKSEVCVSFSRKFNLANYGGPAYEAIDVFVSRKVECSPADLDALTAELQQECVEAVEAAARQYILEMKAKLQQRRTA
jgi:hypothetical protein